MFPIPKTGVFNDYIQLLLAMRRSTHIGYYTVIDGMKLSITCSAVGVSVQYVLMTSFLSCR